MTKYDVLPRIAPMRHSLATRMRAALPGLLFGLRTALAVIVALGIAFTLQLDRADWAGTTAALVCQPVLGSALRKALFRMVGTLVGATATVAVFACFPQDRIGFSLSLAGWCALCGFVGSRLTFFAAYGAMLAGYTAAIIAGDVVNSPDQVFTVALARVTEIELGIVVATTVLATTQSGSSRQHLAAALRGLAEQAVTNLLDILRPASGRAGADMPASLLRLAEVAQMADQVSGEAAHWRFRAGPIRTAQDGLFACFAVVDWLHAGADSRPPPEAGASLMWEALPERLRNGVDGGGRSCLPADAQAGAWALVEFAGREPAMRTRAVRAAGALAAAVDALEVSAWLDDPDRPHPAAAPACTAPPDPLPALVNAARVYLGVVVAAALWMATRWPSGPNAITWAAIPMLLMSPQQEMAASAARGFAWGTFLAAGLAAVTEFALLPQVQTFAGLAAVLAALLVPMAALSTVPRAAALITPATMNFVPLVAPANHMNYDPAAFYNSVFGIVVGCTLAGVTLRVLPPLPVRVRTRRATAAATADCAAIVAGSWRPTVAQWRDRMRTRAIGLPDLSDPAAFAHLLTVFNTGDDALRAFHRDDVYADH